MEREVSDSDGIFSRRLSSNWAELPMTLRRRQKHRPEILSQFTEYSESETEYRRVDSRASSAGQGFHRRSELLRKLDAKEQLRNSMERERRSNAYPDPFYRDNGRNYVIQQEPRRNSRSELLKNLSDEDRKTNSPDSLLVKSSESESSSDEYGHTDDSGAFLENLDKKSFDDKVLQHSRFIKYFAKDDHKFLSKTPSPSESSRLDVNKNVNKNSKIGIYNKNTDPRKDLNGTRYEYENIPRIDISKLDQKPFKKGEMTIEQLRMEEGCMLRNGNGQSGFRWSPDSDCRSSPRHRQLTMDELRLEGLIQDFYASDQMSNGKDRKMSKMETITEEKDNSKLSVREILKRFEELRTHGDDEKSNEKTLNTIHETLKKLDEKVKNYQVW